MAAALVQTSGIQSTASASGSVSWTWASAPTVGNKIIIRAAANGYPTVGVLSVVASDNASTPNAYTARQSCSGGSGGFQTVATYECDVTHVPTRSTLTFGRSAYSSYVAEEWSGLTVGGYDTGAATATAATSPNSNSFPIGPTATLAQAAELVLGLCSMNAGGASTGYSAPAGTTLSAVQQDDNSFVGMIAVYEVVASTAAVSMTFGCAQGTANAGSEYQANIVAFKIATSSISLSGAASSPSAASATLTTTVAIAGSASSNSSAGAALTTAIRLQGSASSPSAASATLGTTVRFAGAATSRSTASAALTTQITLAGAAQSGCSASATLTTGGAGLSGSAVSGSSAGATLTTAIQLAGAAAAPSRAAAALTTKVALAGAAASASRASATLQTTVAIAGAAASSSRAQASLTTPTGINLAGSAQTSTQASAALTTAIAIAGAAASSAQAVATLSSGKLQPGDHWLVDARSSAWRVDPRSAHALVDARAQAWRVDERPAHAIVGGRSPHWNTDKR